MIRIRHFFSLLIITALCSICSAQDIHSVQTVFTKTTNENSRIEHIEGTLYFEIDHGVVIRVTAPVSQWLVSQKNSLLIYYPDDKYAFRLPTQRAMIFSFFQAFMGAMIEDFGLTQFGYSLTNNTIQNDTLITVWSPPQHAESEVGNFTLKYLGDKIVEAELRNANGSVISSSHFSDHMQYKSFYFPCNTETFRYTDTDTVIEHTVFLGPQFNVTIPDSILHFRLPDDVEVQQEKW
ncbi:MAG: hypothetical protein JSW02_07475 [candidate division WOR-3 bacterium]|nr:MAG: hypothetical protein JSW02_07475 [candidate division WOR-3 bacterium]